MTGIVLFTTGQRDPPLEFARCVEEGREPASIASYCSNDFVKSVTDPRTNKVHLWGTTAETKWESVEPGDIALVYGDGRYLAQATVVGTQRNPELAENLWPTDDDAGDTDPREYLTYLIGVEEIEVDRAVFNQLVDYADEYVPKGFLRVADHRIEALEDRHGSVEAAIEGLTGHGVRGFEDDALDTRAASASTSPSSVLLIESGSGGSDHVCSSLLSVAEPETTHLLSVTFDGTPDERLSSWELRNDRLPAKTGVVAVGDMTRSAAASPPAGPGPTRVTVDTIAEPSDLTGLAMAMSSYMEAWEESEAAAVVCFHSITPLLIHADTERVFRFLYTTIGRLRDIGAYAHFHLNSAAHGETTVNLISSLFDAELQVDDEGAVSVNRRR